ncbi:MAG: PaaI family thioesterase [Nitrospirae bacterium]|nr:PaaI family thioesterase [Nitrospirota bacterium]
MRISAAEHEALPSEVEAVIKERMGLAPFPAFLGLKTEEVRRDYARMRLPYRPELNQPAGIMHGGAIVSLIDTVVVMAIISGLPEPPERLLTIDLHTHFMDAVIRQDCIAEAEVRRRGRSIIFLYVEVRTPDGKLVADGSLSYKVVMPKKEGEGKRS